MPTENQFSMNEALQYLASLPDEQARLDAIAEDWKNGTNRFDFAPAYGDTDWGGFRDILTQVAAPAFRIL